MSLLVYGVLRADQSTRALPSGVDGQAVRELMQAELVALVSEHSGDPTPTLERVLAYARVIEACFREGSLVPLRYGAVFADEAALAAMLARERERFVRLLMRVEARVEMSVTVPSAALGMDADSYAGEGHAYLQRRRAAYVDLVSVPAHLERALAGLFVAARAEADARQPGMLRVHFLVPRRDVEAFRRKTEELALTEVSGPWPPYNFVDEGMRPADSRRSNVPTKEHVMAENIDINHASIEELKNVLHLSDEHAHAVVTKRDEIGGFKSWDDLRQVGGMDEGMLAKLKGSGMSLGGGKVTDKIKDAASRLGGGLKKD